MTRASSLTLVLTIALAGASSFGLAVSSADGAVIATEICDNCFDDDNNTFTDRADPMCAAPADGGNVGLSGESDAKGALKCQKGIEKASIAFAVKKLARLSKCVGLAFSCTQLNNVQSCVDKAIAGCNKQVQGIPGDESKAKTAIEKACDDSQGSSISLADITLSTGLGFGAEEGLLDCPATITTASDLADCVVDRQECGVERLLVAAAPRAAEMLAKLGHNVGTDFPCAAIADATNGTDGGDIGLGDSVQAKAAVKCQGTLSKAGLKLGKIGAKIVQKCADAAATCIQVKPGAACQTKVSTQCQKAFTKLNGSDGTLAKLLTATATKCTGPSLGVNELNAPAGLGFVAVTDPSKRCSQFIIQFPDPTGKLVECVGKQYLCEGAQLLERQAPRLREYAGFLGVPLNEVGF